MKDSTLITLSVVLPTYNERVNLPLMVERLENCLKNSSFEIVIVDDNSPDETWKVALELAQSRPCLRVIRRLHDKGLSSAVMAGFEASLGKYLAVMDADLQHDENALPAFLEALEKGADIIVGSRIVAGGGIEDWSIIRQFMSFVASMLAKIVLPQVISDPMSGFFALRREIYEELAGDINPRGFKILLEFVARARHLRIAEVSYVFRGRVYGKSKLSTNVVLDYLAALYDLSVGKWMPRRFLKYAVVGLSGMVTNQCGVWVAINGLNLAESRALVWGIEISILSNFILNNYWTFRDVRLRGLVKVLRGLVSFNTICLGGAFINYASALFFLEKFGRTIYVANLLGVFFGTIWNYIVNSHMTWTNSITADAN
jgi:dolichol-phosphate mannosyltransferase